jgi:hypothetical protein
MSTLMFMDVVLSVLLYDEVSTSAQEVVPLVAP